VGTGGPWPVSAGFLVAPDTEIRYEGDVWRIGDRLRLNYSGPLKAEIRDAEYSPSMGLIQPTHRLVFSGTMSRADISRFDFSVAG